MSESEGQTEKQYTHIIEPERRFIVTDVDPEGYREFMTRSKKSYKQAYVGMYEDHLLYPRPGMTSLRVRIVDDKKASMTLKEGGGVERPEHTWELPLEAAQVAYRCAPFPIPKDRRMVDQYSVDHYDGRIKALLVAEFEWVHGTTPDLPSQPDFIRDMVEVTGKVDNYALAYFAARHLRDEDHQERPAYIAKRVLEHFNIRG